MSKFTVEVIETRSYYVSYVVEAESADAALDKALTGETESEFGEQLSGIADRWATLDDVTEATES
jgi:hypothetical protein